MDVARIKKGLAVAYTARMRTGKGKVEQVDAGPRGHFVRIRDAETKQLVSVRPSQVEPA